MSQREADYPLVAARTPSPLGGQSIQKVDVNERYAMSRIERSTSDSDETSRANRRWWDAHAPDYYAEHGDFLGDAGFVWGPEGWTEAELDILETTTSHTVLEVGAGGGQCSRWLRSTVGCRAVATDISAGMLSTAGAIDSRHGARMDLAQCDGLALPFADESFDRVFTAYGAVPFVADSALLMREMARVTAPGGRVAFSTSHPWRWVFPDDPSERGLTVTQSYFDTTAYVEWDDAGNMTYTEHHRTLEQRVAETLAAGLAIEALHELPWRSENRRTWGGWSPLRGELMPGTLILVARKPGD